MTIPVRLSTGARADVKRAYREYAKVQPHRAQRFTDEFEQFLVDITDNPKLYEALDERYRRCFMKQLPLIIVYRLEPAETVVIGVLPTKADALLRQRLASVSRSQPSS